MIGNLLLETLNPTESVKKKNQELTRNNNIYVDTNTIRKAIHCIMQVAL